MTDTTPDAPLVFDDGEYHRTVYAEHLEHRERERIDRLRDRAGFWCNPCECGGHPECPDCNPKEAA